MGYKPRPAQKVLVLRTCRPDGTSPSPDAKGFRWPESGPVSCDDWDPNPVCGGGLHGLLRGEGNGNLLDWSDDAKWLLVEVDEKTVVDLGGKVKFPRGVVVYFGNKQGALAKLGEKHPDALFVGKIATAGDYGHATAGYGGQATAGDRGHALAGYRGHATAGDYGHATAGDYGHATAGYYGHATAGDYGHATAGYGGHATAGDRGEILIQYWDQKALRYRTKVGAIGESGLKTNTAYRLNDRHEFKEV